MPASPILNLSKCPICAITREISELAEEIKTMNPEILEKIKLLLPDTPISFIPHEEMKKELNNCHAFIRTGEMTSYANIILVSGVVF